MTHTILDTIGATPMVEIQHLNPNPNVKLLAKLEGFNPGGSIKDRAALSIIEAGERSGELTPDKTVIEATSGNTGIGLALVCSVKGYKLLLAMSEAVSVERQKILKARGAGILLTPGHLGTDGAIEEVYNLARENPGRYFMSDQFNNEANWKAHYNGTAVEIWEQSAGRITHLVATLGTSGTLMGCARRLKEFNPDVNIIGVEPYLGHKIQGLKNMKEAYCPEIFEKERLDCKMNIEDEDAFEMTRRLAREEGIFVGMSSGAAMAVAVKTAARMDAGVLVVVLPDGGERYLSTPVFAVQEQVGLKLFNTLSRSKEVFTAQVPGAVSMYTCGPTAHARMPLAETRRYIFADLLSRYLTYRGYDVKHAINITDLDDKTITGAEKAGQSLAEYTQTYIDAFQKDLALLGIRPADVYPKASEHVDDMVQMVDKLVLKGLAYEKLRSLYFDISRFPEYGRLSGIDIDKIKLGATVDLEEYEKDNPRDFTLLKRSKLSELKRGIYAKTRWGNVRPSWHVQCPAMAMKHLGETFDIHTAGRHLIFPHHENEIAIASGLTGKRLANYWLHCDQLQFEVDLTARGAKPLTLDAITELGYTGREIRYWLLTVHYRKSVTFSLCRLEYARKALQRLDFCTRALVKIKQDAAAYGELPQLIYDIKNAFVHGMDDDLNISAAMAGVFKAVRTVNRLIAENRLGAADAQKIIDAFQDLNTVLNIFDFEQPANNAEVQQLLQEREQARQARNWELADRLRDRLVALGVTCCDGAQNEINKTQYSKVKHK